MLDVIPRWLVAGALGTSLCASAVAVGWIDLGRTADLLTGRSVSGAAAFALLAAVCWVGAGVVLATVAAAVMSRLGGTTDRWRRAELALLAGSIALGLGISHQQSGYRVCCATPASTQQAEHLVH